MSRWNPELRVLTALVVALAAFLVLSEPTRGMARETTVSVVSDSAPGPGAAHGLKKILAALKAKEIAADRAATLESATGEIVIVTGLAAGSGSVSALLGTSGISPPTTPEALVIQHAKSNGKPVLLVAGADDRGLLYAELDVADRIGWSSDPSRPLGEVRDSREKPAVVERSLSMYTMNRARFESYFYDEDYWAEYLDLLARSRFNTFALLFGYENAGYFAPPYPYFFDVDGFPDVRVIDLTKEEQQRNLKALNRVIEMTHERGLDFTLGIWDHLYRGGVQGPTEFAKRATPGLVWGLTGENLVVYSKAALAKFLREVPRLDAIQFRMHGESGLKRGEMKEFWENIYRIVKESGRDIRFDARAKNFPDSLIDKALEEGIDIRICTKYWAEQMGLPFHPTHINRQNQLDRRHGYADLLRYPQRYKIHWRLWNGGTTRILLWGDPEYVRRFSESTHLYGGEGFEVNEPLATKMQDHPHDMKPFDLLTPKYRYTKWEFQRYWHFYQLFGRLGYDPDTPPEVWRHEFERRFGKEAARYVERGIHRASQVLPRIVATCFPYNRFPTTRGWVEKQRREDLATYARAEASDIQQFLSIDEAARFRLEGRESAKVWPQQTSRWFAETAREVLELVDEAERRIGDHASKEFASTIVDLRILANLALYHSRRIHAGLSLALFTRSRDASALADAIIHEGKAIKAWESLVEAAGDVYSGDLMFGRRRVGLSGHWRDELAELESGLEELMARRKSFRPEANETGPSIVHVPVRRSRPGADLRIKATIGTSRPLESVRVIYESGQKSRHANMKQRWPDVYCTLIPGSDITGNFKYFIEAVDRSGRRTNWPQQGSGKEIAVMITADEEAPTVTHTPIQSAPANQRLTVVASVTDPSGVKWARLRYRSVTQHEDYRTLPMVAIGKDQFRAEVPAEHIPVKFDFMYLIEVMDQRGNGKIYPDLEKESPYIVVKLRR